MKSKGSRKQNEQNWRELIEKCKSSGKCQREWCTENNVSEKAFYYWRRKLAKETAAESETTIGEIVQIHLQSSHSEEKVFQQNRYLTYLLTELPKFGDEPTEEQIKSVLPWSESLPECCKIKNGGEK